LLSSSVQIGTELCESSDLTILSKFELEWTGNLFHSFDLSSWTDTGHRKTDVDGGTDTLVEEFRFEENLAISNWDNVCGNVSRHITGLSLNDGESSQRSASVVLVHLSCTLEKTRVKIEDITGVGLTTWGTSEKEGHLTVSNGLLWEIVVDDESMHSVVTEVFTDSAAWVGSEELQGSSIGSCGSNNNGVFKCFTLTEKTHDVGDSGPFLADGDVDAVKGLGAVASIVASLLVENSVDGNRSFSGLSVANDKFTLATTDWDLWVFY
jgi:hypothetical protein